jgi:hypothetical protein
MYIKKVTSKQTELLQIFHEYHSEKKYAERDAMLGILRNIYS